MAKKKKDKNKNNGTRVLINFPERIETHLVQSNELKHYEIFQWLSTIVSPIAVGFWTAYFTSNQPSALFWSALAFTLMSIIFIAVAIKQRKKIFGSSVKKGTELDDFTHYLESKENK